MVLSLSTMYMQTLSSLTLILSTMCVSSVRCVSWPQHYVCDLYTVGVIPLTAECDCLPHAHLSSILLPTHCCGSVVSHQSLTILCVAFLLSALQNSMEYILQSRVTGSQGLSTCNFSSTFWNKTKIIKT